MKTKQLILEEIEQIPEIKLPEILNLIRSFKEKLNSSENSYKPIWEVADEIIKDIPEKLLVNYLKMVQKITIIISINKLLKSNENHFC